MKLLEAMEIVRAPIEADTPVFRLFLVCGFNALHLQTFLTAEVRRQSPNRRLEVCVGLYGDLWGNLERAREADRDVVVVLLEWQDLDARLGIRNLGGWEPSALEDIVESVRRKTEQLGNTIPGLAKGSPVVVSLPGMPLPPAAFTPGWRASALEADVKSHVAVLAARLARSENVRVLGQQRLDELSPLAERADIRSEITTGFPYNLEHASILAELLSRLCIDSPPKKGLITDLDDTLWRGIVGEVGPDGVSWDLDHHSQMHGLYQQFLGSLAGSGTLLGVASKNDPAVVAEAFRRSDILLAPDHVFPVEVHWRPKSESIARILKAWNIGADSVVFVDDNPSELAEVRSAHPAVEVLRFPKEPEQVFQLLVRLRDLFGKDSVTEEDGFRLQSLRHAYSYSDGSEGAFTPDAFLREAQPQLSMNFVKEPPDPRAFDLINKTNQFNLNGRRYTSAEWQKYTQSPQTFVLVVSYRDKYGPLGKIAVLTGQPEDRSLRIDNWVMSCRAFGKRIEYACMNALYEEYGANEIHFDFTATERNGPITTFLEKMLGTTPRAGSRLPKDQFMERRLETFNAVAEVCRG